MLVIRDITYILRHEKSRIKSNFQQQLTATLSHEQMTPLNSILALSDIVHTQMKQAAAADQKIACAAPHMNPISFLKVIWSSAKVLQHMLQS
jgi:signal transduction histidine kinase